MGRDVVFKLRVEDDPRNKSVMGSFAAKIAEMQKMMDNAIGGGRGRGSRGSGGAGGGPTDDFKDRLKLAGQLLNRQIKDADTLAAKHKKVADDDFKYRLKLAGDLLNKQIKDAETLAKTHERLVARTAREARHHSRLEMIYERRREQGIQRVAGGAIRAIGGIGGYIGGDTGSALANVALGSHVAMEAYHGARGIAGGIGAIRSGGTLAAGSGAAVSLGAPTAIAGAAALVAWLPALAAAVQGATIAIKGSSSTGKVFAKDENAAFGRRVGGSLGSAFGEGIVGAAGYYHPDFLIAGQRSTAALEGIAGGREDINTRDVAGLELSRRNLTRQQKQTELDVQVRKARREQYGRIGISTYDAGRYASRDTSAPNIGSARSLGRGSLGGVGFLSGVEAEHVETGLGEIQRQRALDAIGISSRRQDNATSGRDNLIAQRQSALNVRETSQDSVIREQAEQRILELTERIRAIKRDDLAISKDEATQRVSTAKQEYDIRKSLADQARQNTEAGAKKFLFDSPGNRARALAGHRALTEGRPVTRQQLQAVDSYGIDKEKVNAEARRQAEAYGFGGLGLGEEEKRLKKEADEAGTKFDAATVELDNKFKIEVSLKTDEAFDEAFDKEFAPILKEMSESVDNKLKKMREDFEGALRRLRGNTQIPGASGGV